MKRGRVVFLVAALAASAACSQRPLAETSWEESDASVGGGQGGGDGAGTGGADAGGDVLGTGGAGGAATLPVGWVEVPGPQGFTNEGVSDAWSAGPDDFFFASNGYGKGHGATEPWGARILRWTAADGWREELVILPASSGIRSLSGTGPDDVWTAGNGHVYHRDAGGWQMIDDETWRPQVGAAGPLSFVSVAARGPGDVWFAAPQFLLHRTADGWSSFVMPEPASWLSRLWLGQKTDVWVSGGQDADGDAANPAFVARYADGGLHTESPDSFWLSPVTSAWPTSDGGFWFAEPGYWRLVNSDQYLMVPLCHYGGGHTVEGITQTVGDPELRIASLWGRADDDVWAAGGYGDRGQQAGSALFHYDGDRWTAVADAPAAGRYVLVTGDAQSTWLVTEGPRFFRQLRR
jgi:hypothetical protein